MQGSPPPSPVSTTVTQKVNLQVPGISVTPTPGRVQLNNLFPAIYGSGYALFDGGGNGAKRGIDWSVRVNTPAPFSSQGASLWNFVQLVVPQHSRTDNSNQTHPSVLNGQSGLDGTYPYDPGPFSGSFPGGHAADNLLWTSGDSPGFPVENVYQGYTVTDTFNTYVMYNPPGGDTQWVPLWDINWYWTATVTRPGTSWSTWDDSSSAGIVRVTNTTSTTTHPRWSALVQAPPSGGF